MAARKARGRTVVDADPVLARWVVLLVDKAEWKDDATPRLLRRRGARVVYRHVPQVTHVVTAFPVPKATEGVSRLISSFDGRTAFREALAHEAQSGVPRAFWSYGQLLDAVEALRCAQVEGRRARRDAIFQDVADAGTAALPAFVGV
jgi:hypothetical protein